MKYKSTLSTFFLTLSAACIIAKPSITLDTMPNFGRADIILTDFCGVNGRDIVFDNLLPEQLPKIEIKNCLRINNSQQKKINFVKKKLNKLGYNLEASFDSIEIWKIYVYDTLQFYQSAHVRSISQLKDSLISPGERLDSNAYFQKVMLRKNYTKFEISLNLMFHPSEYGYYYDSIYWFPKAIYPIEIDYQGILDSDDLIFDYIIPLFFQNNFHGMRHYYAMYYGLETMREYRLRKRIHLSRAK